MSVFFVHNSKNAKLPITEYAEINIFYVFGDSCAMSQMYLKIIFKFLNTIRSDRNSVVVITYLTFSIHSIEKHNRSLHQIFNLLLIQVLLTAYDIIPYYLYMIISVRARLFVQETQRVHHFVHDDAFLHTSRALQRQGLHRSCSSYF